LTGFSFLGRLKESYIQWALKASWTDVFKKIPTIICVTGTIGIALKFTTLFDRLVYFPLWPNICDSVFLVASALYLGCYGIGILGRKPQSSMDSNSVLETFKALVDDAFRDSPLNLRQNKAAAILSEAHKHFTKEEFKERLRALGYIQ